MKRMKPADLRETRRVYTHLADDRSRKLYEKRVMWSLTGDGRYIDDIIGSLIYKRQADAMMEQAARVSDRLVIRGIGNEYQMLKTYYPKLEFVLFVDRDPVKVGRGIIDGHKVISVEDFYRDYADYYVIVNSSAYNKEILSELTEHGIPEGHIFNFGALTQSSEQYFETGIITPQPHEVFIDGGCYDGSTVRRFVDWCGGDYDAVYSFEPDGANYEMASKSFGEKPVPRLKLYQRGLWSEETTLRFAAESSQSSRVVEPGGRTTEIKTVSIDGILKGARASFIKLDVEGAEYEALMGAKDTICAYHPRMAISIYHKAEDIFKLPELVLSFSEDYRFYLRHYQLSQCETILYAV